MYQLGSLFGDRLNDLRMAMAGRTHGDAGVAIEKDVVVRVGYPDAVSVISNEFVIRPRIARRNVFRICVDNFEGFWSRQSGFNEGLLQFVCWGHGFLLN